VTRHVAVHVEMTNGGGHCIRGRPIELENNSGWGVMQMDRIVLTAPKSDDRRAIRHFRSVPVNPARSCAMSIEHRETGLSQVQLIGYRTLDD